jgi:oxygen-independent coproporphyrinogen-3 oxidase
MAEFLYVHIPFCVKKCLYCDFLSVPYDNVIAERYIEALCREVTLRKSSIGKLRGVYIGGGTPSILSDSAFRQLLDSLREDLTFSSGVEITVETNPGTLTEAGTSAMLAIGANRISMGVQSFNDGELRALGRIHSAVEARRSAEMLKRCGLRNLSLDLMYGIPGQTLGTWKKTLSDAVDLSPSHISAYELTPEKGTPLYELISSGKVLLPKEDIVVEMYSYAIDYLASAGYVHYEISNFSLPGAACIHNLNYWNRGDYVGVGAGAHSFIDGVRSANTGNIEEYISRIEVSEVPAVELYEVRPAEASKEFLFLGLRKRQGIAMEEAARRGINIFPECREMFDRGYLTTDGTYVALTEKGRIVSNTVIVRLFELLGL